MGVSKVSFECGGLTYGGHGNSPGNLADDGAVGAESGAGDVLAGVAVDGQGGNDVKRGIDGLQSKQGLGELLGVAELADEAEPRDVATVGEDGIGNAVEGRGEAGVVDAVHLGVGGLGSNAEGNDGEQNSGKNAQEGWRMVSEFRGGTESGTYR